MVNKVRFVFKYLFFVPLVVTFFLVPPLGAGVGCGVLQLMAGANKLVKIQPHSGFRSALTLRPEQALAAINSLRKGRLLFQNDREFLGYRTRRWTEKTRSRLTELTINVKLIISESSGSQPFEVILEIFGKGHGFHNEIVEELAGLLPQSPEPNRYTHRYFEYLGGGGVVVQKKKGEDFFTFASMDRETYRRGGYDAGSIVDRNDAEKIFLKDLRKSNE